MYTPDIKQVKDFEGENRRLKQIFADLSLECRVLKTLSRKKLNPAIKRELVSLLIAQFTMSICQACRTLSLSRAVCYHQPDTRHNEPVTQALTDMAECYPRYDFYQLFEILLRQGHAWNHML